MHHMKLMKCIAKGHGSMHHLWLMAGWKGHGSMHHMKLMADCMEGTRKHAPHEADEMNCEERTRQKSVWLWRSV
jgi:hypothetical protein